MKAVRLAAGLAIAACLATGGVVPPVAVAAAAATVGCADGTGQVAAILAAQGLTPSQIRSPLMAFAATCRTATLDAQTAYADGDGAGRPALPAGGVALARGCGADGGGPCQAYTGVRTQITSRVGLSTAGPDVHVGSMTAGLAPSANPFSAEMAVAVAATWGQIRGRCGTVLAGGANPFVLRYQSSHWPADLRGRPFNYPTASSFLALLRRYGWIAGGAITLAGAPHAVEPVDVLTRQPSLGSLPQLRGLAAVYPRADALALPGVLYVNTTLAYDPATAKWRVSEWNYNFAVSADFVRQAQTCTQPGPPAPGPRCGSPFPACVEAVLGATTRQPSPAAVPCPDGKDPAVGRPASGCAEAVLTR